MSDRCLIDADPSVFAITILVPCSSSNLVTNLQQDNVSYISDIDEIKISPAVCRSPTQERPVFTLDGSTILEGDVMEPDTMAYKEPEQRIADQPKIQRAGSLSSDTKVHTSVGVLNNTKLFPVPMFCLISSTMPQLPMPYIWWEEDIGLGITQHCPKPCGPLKRTTFEANKSTIVILCLKYGVDPRRNLLDSRSWRGSSPRASSNVMGSPSKALVEQGVWCLWRRCSALSHDLKSPIPYSTVFPA